MDGSGYITKLTDGSMVQDVATTDGDGYAKITWISGLSKEHDHDTKLCYHTHGDNCYKACGGQLFTPFGSHYIHNCRTCDNSFGNSVFGWDKISAEPGENCNMHGTCGVKNLICKMSTTEPICGFE